VADACSSFSPCAATTSKGSMAAAGGHTRTDEAWEALDGTSKQVRWVASYPALEILLLQAARGGGPGAAVPHMQRSPQLCLGVKVGGDGSLSQRVGEAEEEGAGDALAGAVGNAHVGPGLGGRGARKHRPRLGVDHLAAAGGGEGGGGIRAGGRSSSTAVSAAAWTGQAGAARSVRHTRSSQSYGPVVIAVVYPPPTPFSPICPPSLPPPHSKAHASPRPMLALNSGPVGPSSMRISYVRPNWTFVAR
jgi:hypothetical protein